MKTVEVLERTMQRVEIQHLVALLVIQGAIPKDAAINYFVGLAEFTRSLEVADQLRAYADQKAVHYEDMANLLTGQGLLPR